MREVEAEADAAALKYGPFTSTHEAYGVLAEENAELLDAIHFNSARCVAGEALQVAAVALRLYEQAMSPTDAFFERSGFER